MIKQKYKKYYCPVCNNQLVFCIDEWGFTPSHTHCDICDINIGASSIEEGYKLIQKYNKPHTKLEYIHRGKEELILLLIEDGKLIINNYDIMKD